MSELPENWVSCQFGEVADILGGGTPSSKDPTNFTEEGGSPWITPSDLSGYKGIYISRGARNLTDKGLTGSSAKMMPAGSVLFSSRAPVGYVAIAENDLSTNQGFKSFILPEELNSRFIYFYLRNIKTTAEAMATGTTFKELSGAKAAQLPLLIAPLPEQKRIADKLDSLLSRVDSCQSHLDNVPQILERFRQSVLAEATSGRLTEEWREENNKEYAWQITNLGTVITDIRYGTSKKSTYDLENEGIPVLRIPNVVNGKIDTSDLKFGTFTEKELDSLSLREGDLLLIRSNGSIELVGRTAIVSKEIEDFLYAGYLIRLRFDQTMVDAPYINYYLSSPKIRSHIELTARSTSGVNNINSKEVKSIPLRLPPLEEQHEIARRIEHLFSFAERLEAQWQSGKDLVEKLIPSMLAKAFRGELVEQDPDDEPAAVLLERIKAARAARPKKTKRVSKPTRTREKKMTEESVKEVIGKFKNKTFSFDELKEKVPGDYEELKNILFSLLSADNPVITQVFDKSAESICFTRSTK